MPKESPKNPKGPRRWKRGLLIAGASTAALGVGMWVAIHEVPGFGPWLAEGVRSIVGPGPVAWAEDVVYGVEDWVNVRTKGDDAPTTYWEAPKEAEPIVVVDEKGHTVVLDPKVDAPPAFEPPHEKVAAEGDGTWTPFRLSSDNGPVNMWRSLVHPDPKRPFAAVAVVAMDLSKIDLHIVAGTEEPKSQRVPRADRPGLVPDTDQKDLIAAFNGGFRAEHGNYGMKIAGAEFLPPRDIACTLAKEPSGMLTIRTFSNIKERQDSFAWYRQTPPCLVEEGAPNPGLLHEFNRNWGAAVGGDTIIRRSAIGISKDGRYLFYALGDATTAQSIGKAMLAVGAYQAAQLDVNFSYPRFFLFEHGEAGPSIAEGVIPGLKHKPTEYVGLSEQRDFFYVTRKKSATSRAEAPSPPKG
ncbi:MAG: hypothetical protein HOW73_01350 [Polyangiaceae bacterium]|nr:hypothetical protein [Polyangiaceae bacterium]